MRQVSCVAALAAATLLVVACGNDAQPAPPRADTSAAVPRNTPTLPTNSVTIKGEASLKLDTGQDILVGTKVQLVNALAFQPQWDATLKRLRTRYCILQIQNIVEQQSKADAARKQLVTTASSKEAELSKALTQGWATFEYNDPITGQSSFVEVGPDVLALMRSRIQTLQLMIQQAAAQLAELDRSAQEKKETLAGLESRYASMSVTEIAATADTSLGTARSEGDLTLQSINEIIAALDHSTVDSATVDKTGEFNLEAPAGGRYLVYAHFSSSTTSLTWLLPVEEKNGKPRKVVLSTQNTLDLTTAMDQRRAAALANSLQGIIPRVN